MPDYPPRIVRIEYKSGINRRLAVAFAKVPYGGMYDLTEKMTRLFTQRQVTWFRIEEAKPEEIEQHRHALERWPEALRRTVKTTRIDVLA